jgi:hypothetical protein
MKKILKERLYLLFEEWRRTIRFFATSIAFSYAVIRGALYILLTWIHYTHRALFLNSDFSVTKKHNLNNPQTPTHVSSGECHNSSYIAFL